MQIIYNEAKNEYEVIVLTSNEKNLCAPMMERYGFRWSDQKKIYWAPENEMSSMLIQMVAHLKGAELRLPKKLTLAINIRNFFGLGNYNFADIAIMSEVTEEEVKKTVVCMYNDSDLRRMGIYEKIIDRDTEYAVMSCLALFPETEDKAIQYILKERGVVVSDSNIAAIRKKNEASGNGPGKPAKKDVGKPEKARQQKTPAGKNEDNTKSAPKGSNQDPAKKKWDMEQVRVSNVKREYYEEHNNCTSIHVREALKKGSFDIPHIAEKAGVKEETVKCKIAELLSKEELDKYGFLDSFIMVDKQAEDKIVQYISRQGELPETWQLRTNIMKSLSVGLSLSCLKTVMKKHDINEYQPDIITRPKRKAR